MPHTLTPGMNMVCGVSKKKSMNCIIRNWAFTLISMPTHACTLSEGDLDGLEVPHTLSD